MRAPDVTTIALTFADGTVGIMSYVIREYRANGSTNWSRSDTPAEIEAEILRTSAALDKVKVPVRSWRIINVNDIPADRTFRNALRDNKGKLEHDMPAARELHRAAIRVARASKFAQLDVAYQRADEVGDAVAKTDVVAVKQVLRDMTDDAAIDAAQTVEELKAFWPTELT